MSRMMHINVCFIRCRYRHRLLRHIWINKCIILLNRRNSRRIPWLCWSHKWMRNHVEQLHVIWRTLARHYTNLAYRCNIVTELHPLASISSIEAGGATGYGGRVWMYPNYRTTLFGQWMIVKGPHLRWSKNKEMASNSLNERWSPYGI